MDVFLCCAVCIQAESFGDIFGGKYFCNIKYCHAMMAGPPQLQLK